jgi:predicted PolB exonuclease-like 3'-5' exonuclease
MNSIPVENLFLIDIETVSEARNYDSLNEEWKDLWNEKIHKALPEKISAEEFYPLRAGIMAEFAKVVCISIGYFRTENNSLSLRVKSFYSENEKDILEQFIQTLYHLYSFNNKWTFTGHNIKEFDIPFLCRRILVNGLPIPVFFDFQNMKPWETPIIDTLHLWRFGDYKHYTSLKLLAAALGVPSPKDDIDGSQVGAVYWEEKNLQRIAFYCQKDVATVANIILRFKGLPLLKEEQIIYVP